MNFFTLRVNRAKEYLQNDVASLLCELAQALSRN